MRHSWTNSVKHYGGETSTCSNCGIKRHRRHARGTHWTEWQDAAGEYIDADRTPPCEPKPTALPHQVEAKSRRAV